jgi:hypothetical protein
MEPATVSALSPHDLDLAKKIKAMRLADVEHKIKAARANLEVLEDLRSRWQAALPEQVLEESASFEHDCEEREEHEVLEERLHAIEYQVVQEEHDTNLIRRERNHELVWLAIGAAPAAYVASLFPEASAGAVGLAIYLWCVLLVLGSAS